MTALRIVEPPAPGVSWWDPEPGDMWPCSIEAHHIEGRSPCWVIRLPAGAYVWHTNSRTTNEAKSLWTVTGEPPLITVSPSINVGPEIWHGHIVNGEMNP